MNKKIFYFFVIVESFFVIPEANAQWVIMSKDADSLVKIGSDYVYNIEFEKARECFKQVQTKYPNHPAGYFLDAMILVKIQIINENKLIESNIFFFLS